MKKYNVILLVTDDQGYGDISANGNPWLETPNLDYLHNNSISLESFHTDPLCAPTRASLMSGMYSFGAGVYSTINGRYYMKPELKTMADYFKEGGYATGMFGKWHLGDTYPYRPHERGFDIAYSFGGGVIGETPDYWNNDYFDDVYTINGKETKFEGYCTDNWFSSAIEFIDKNVKNNKPFFCYLPTNAPHGPMNVSPKYYQKYIDKGIKEKRAKFYGMIECIDDNLGNLIEHLKSINEWENTIFIYFGDNGTATGCDIDENSFVIDGYNAGMRGKKGTTYEGAHRNACFITSPNSILGNPRKVYGITTQFDLLPTLIDICKLPKGEDYNKLDGISMAKPLMNGETKLNKGRTVVIHNMQRDMPQKYKDYTVLRDEYRLVKPMTPETNHLAMGNFQIPKELPPEIYNIENDPEERNNIYEKHVSLANELTLFYEDWYDNRVDYAIKYSPVYFNPKEEVKITCHAWHDCYKMCFSQNHIRSGVNSTGFWAVKIIEDGEYLIELRRWPRESKLALRDSCEEMLETDSKEYKPVGKSYPIVEARVSIGDIKTSYKVKKEDNCAKMRLYLKEGEYNMRTKFILEDGSYIGAYYAYISKI